MQRTGTSTPLDFHHYFQPVYDLTEMRVIGFEALMRGRTNLPPSELMLKAKEQNRLIEVDAESVEKAIATFFSAEDQLNGDETLFVNVFPETLGSKRFLDVMRTVRNRYGDRCRRVVFEINETVVQAGMWHTPEFATAIDRIRLYGFQLAMDDVGEGTTNFRKMIELAPDYFKLDKFFAGGICRSERVRHFISLLVDYCRGHTRLILEGIENEEQCRTAMELGIASGQGYWLGKPAPLDNFLRISHKCERDEVHKE